MGSGSLVRHGRETHNQLTTAVKSRLGSIARALLRFGNTAAPVAYFRNQMTGWD